MTDHLLEPRIARLEGKQDALDTYLPALLNRLETGFAEIRADMTIIRAELRDDMGAMRAELRDDLRAMETNLRSDMRASRWERIAIILTLAVGFASVIATLLAG